MSTPNEPALFDANDYVTEAGLIQAIMIAGMLPYRIGMTVDKELRTLWQQSSVIGDASQLDKPLKLAGLVHELLDAYEAGLLPLKK